MRTERSEPPGFCVVEGVIRVTMVVSSISTTMLLTVGVTDSKAAISGATTLGHEGFNTSSAGGRMIRFDSLQNDGSKIDRLKTMYQRKMVSIETEQGVLKSDPL